MIKAFSQEITKAVVDPVVGIGIAELAKGKALNSFGTRIAAGKKVGCHAHFHGEEWYIILAGEGRMYLGDVENQKLVNLRNHDVKQGDIFCIPLGTAHQLQAESQLDLIFLCPNSHLVTDRILFPDMC
ncbi:cupin domain-containing protein [Yersinia sp. J1]|uniref:cupin domain-containing protein n=1 Tax=Yersinia sp. J1 TaxID=3424774 RepID=UPI003D36FB8C